MKSSTWTIVFLSSVVGTLLTGCNGILSQWIANQGTNIDETSAALHDATQAQQDLQEELNQCLAGEQPGPGPQWRLVKAEVTFNTGNNGKEPRSLVTTQARSQTGEPLAYTSSNYELLSPGSVRVDQLGLQNTVATPDEAKGGRVTVSLAARGRARWKVTFAVELTFIDRNNPSSVQTVSCEREADFRPRDNGGRDEETCTLA